MYRGVVIAESLSDRSCLRQLRVLSQGVADISSPASGQPGQWTTLSFEVEDERVDEVAEALRRCLLRGPWYVDFNDGNHSYVVFADRIFTYEKGDAATLESVRSHARLVGVPDEQIDWAVPS